jgi:hypothetical protein
MINSWERRSPAPDSGNMRRHANTLGIRPEEIALPGGEDWVVVRGHRFHLTARREEPGMWVARVAGWDHGDAIDWPLRAGGPDYPDNDSPYIMTYWRVAALTADRAIKDLARRIVAAMERAISPERLPDVPPDGRPPEAPEQPH